MRALTLWQPWAWAVVAGHKPIENRPWPIPRSMIGVPFALHAGKRWDERGADAIADLLDLDELPPAARVTGAIVGTAVVSSASILGVGVRRDTPPGILPVEWRRWFFGPYGWPITGTAIPEPIPCRGLQGFWPLPADLEDQVRAQLARVA